MKNNERFNLDFMEKGIPILDNNPILELFVDFSPSEFLNPDIGDPHENFASSICMVTLCADGVESKLKKYSSSRTEHRRINYLNSVLQMIKDRELGFSTLCLMQTKKSRYMDGFLNIKGKIAPHACNHRVVSVSGVLMAIYFGVYYYLTMLIHHKMTLPQDVNVMIDRFPGEMSDYLEIFDAIKKIYEDMTVSSFYKGNINIGILKKGVEDPPGLLLADMMAHLHKTFIDWEDPNESAEDNGSQQVINSEDLIQGYTPKEYADFIAFVRYLKEEKQCLAVKRPQDCANECKEILYKAGIGV